MIGVDGNEDEDDRGLPRGDDKVARICCTAGDVGSAAKYRDAGAAAGCKVPLCLTHHFPK